MGVLDRTMVLILKPVNDALFEKKGGERRFVHEIKLRILRWRGYPGLPGGPKCHHKYSYKRKRMIPYIRREEGHVKMEHRALKMMVLKTGVM